MSKQIENRFVLLSYLELDVYFSLIFNCCLSVKKLLHSLFGAFLRPHNLWMCSWIIQLKQITAKRAM